MFVERERESVIHLFCDVHVVIYFVHYGCNFKFDFEENKINHELSQFYASKSINQ